MEIAEISTASEDAIIKEAARRGYIIRAAPPHYENPGYRVGESKVIDGPDLWMNAANNRLWEIQKSK